ncbi:coiled-coil domain-containing protein [Neobacillus sp. K501]
MKKRITAISAFMMLGIGSPTVTPLVHAEENESLDNQRSKIQMEILDANVELMQVKNELERLNEQIIRVEQAILDNNKMIVETEEKIKVSQKEIEDLEQEISILEEKVFKRNEVLKKRVISFQESGGKVSYLDALLGSVSFADFIDRMGAVATMVEADQNLIKIHEEDILNIEKKHTEVKTKLLEQKEMMTELEGMSTQILEQKQQNEQLKEELKNREQETLSEQENLQQQDRELAVSLGFDVSDLLNDPQLFRNETVQKVVTAGFRYIGSSVYVFGGGRSEEDVANGRFDCSGFVHWAFSQADIQIGASTETLKNEGTPVKVTEMLPGDLVFFDTYKKDGHVGIYLGNGKFIGSQSSTGIAIADMTNGYWLETFNGRVNRIIADSESEAN